MRRGFLRRNATRICSILVVAAAAASLIAYAIAQQGYSSEHLALNDGGVWVTQSNTGRFGRMNKPIEQLDGYVYAPDETQGAAINVLQDGAAVVGEDLNKGLLYPIDVTGQKADVNSGIPLPPRAQVGMGGGVLALVDGTKGAVHAMRYDPDQPLTSTADLLGSKPLATVGSGAALAVGQDGTIYVASPEHGLTTIRPSDVGFEKPTSVPLRGLTSAQHLSVTAAGDEPVVLADTPDSQDAVAILADGTTRFQIPAAAKVVLQQPGPAADSVLVATAKALLALPLAGGHLTTLFDGGNAEQPAAPVQFGGCLFAAWPGAPGEYAGTCSDAKPTGYQIKEPSSKLAFRINRQQLVLNDETSGRTWNVDSGEPQQVAHWLQNTTRATEHQDHHKNNQANTDQAHATPPKANDDTLGARPGDTTALYVLDNDSDPSGEVLAVDSISASPQVSKWLSIAPDGQTISIALPAGYTGTASFKYTEKAGKGTSSAEVTVHSRSSDQNAPPTPRRGYTPHTWSVPAGGTITIPVLDDWRDYTDGDPVVLADAEVKGGQVATTPEGTLVYTAPAGAGKHTIHYEVSDGHGGTAKAAVTVDVQAADGSPVAALANPDYARGDAGRPIVIDPLANDMPGSDPVTPAASLQIASPLASPAGTKVQTDLATGQVTVTAAHPGTYSLGYQAAYGTAPFAHGTIRVDVDPPGKPTPPVTAPDVAVLHGQSPEIVDVLANDADSAGNLLVVQQARAEHPDQLQVAVLRGRYVEITAKAATIAPMSQTVDYTVTDGVTGLVSGQITVTQLKAPENDTPITLTDYATVRSGQSVAIPVLDNDSTPAGDPLSLVKDVSTAGPGAGQFRVEPAKTGAAYVAGGLVRFVAPKVSHTTTATIDYYAQNSAGDQQVGQADVTITPPPSKKNPDQQPTPQEVDERVVAGDTVVIKIPTTGVDPDGDTLTVTGIDSNTTLGRVLGFGASSITYQAYPKIGNGGTDTFGYTVSDGAGETATGTVRVAVVPPGDPQPPVAVDDTLTAAPGATVQIDPLTNDLIAPGDTVHIEPLANSNSDLASSTARLTKPQGPIVVHAPKDTKHAVQVKYRLTDGLSSSDAEITVHSQKGIDIPPVAYDQYAHAQPGATSVTVDLLHGDYDPDSAGQLTVVSPRTGVRNGKLTVHLSGQPQVVPYVIKDSKGATASGVAYVPAARSGLPYSKPNAQIQVPFGGSKQINIADYVIDPAGKPVHTTLAQTISASPSDGLQVSSKNGTHLLLTAGKGYAGPAEITFQVTDGAGLKSPGAQQAYITVPVQVGKPTPVFSCPSNTFDVVEGGQPISIRMAAICHIWTPEPGDAPSVQFAGKFKTPLAGVSIQDNAPTLTLQAGASARPGSSAVLVMSLAKFPNAPTQTLSVRVVPAPKPTVSPITVDGLDAGQSKTIDIAGSVSSPLLNGVKIGIVGTPRQTAGMPAGVTARGSSITVTPGKDTKGTLTFTYVATDVADQPRRADRQVTGSLTVHVLGHPDAPTNVQPGQTVKSNEVDLSWTAPASNGSPIDNYLVTWNGGSKSCGAAPKCPITGLTNGKKYQFQVMAHNAVGNSPKSALSPVAVPDAVPDPVSGFTASNPRDGQLTLTWTPDRGNFSPVTKYVISWQGGGATVSAGTHRLTAQGLDNDKSNYSFKIIAWNAKGPSPSAPASGATQSAGRPGTPGAPQVGVSDDTSSNKQVVSLSWGKVDAQGPTPLDYLVRRTGGSQGTVTVCNWTENLSCTDPSVALDGTTYHYSVQARNGEQSNVASHTSPFGPSTTVEAAATPDPITNLSLTPTGNNGEATLKFDAPASHGKSSTVTCTLSTGGNCSGSPWTFPTSGQAGVSETLSGLPNGQQVTATLHDCNGASGTNYSQTACDADVTASATTYGPIGNPQVSASNNGTTVNWSVSVDPNGKPATVHVTTDHGYDKTFTTGVGSWSYSDSQNVGYSTTDHISVTVSDSGRASTSGSASATTPNPPPPPSPSISASKSSGYMTGSAGSCTSTAAHCWGLNVTVHNFKTGYYTWSCQNNSGTYFTSTSTIHVSSPDEAFGDVNWCLNGYPNQTIKISFGGVTSNGVSE